MDGETPFVQVYAGYGGYAVRSGEDLHVTSDIDHVLRIVYAALTEADETDPEPVEAALKRNRKPR